MIKVASIYIQSPGELLWAHSKRGKCIRIFYLEELFENPDKQDLLILEFIKKNNPELLI